MGLSSNTLWHQTDFYPLQRIIKEKKINVNYSLEDLKSISPYPFNYAFPMISFSDIPLSEFGAHIDKYGGHSIGFKRDWIVRNNFSPVSYYSNHSILLRELIERIEYLKQDYGSLNNEQKHDLKVFLFQLAHSKNYEGYLKTKSKEYKNYRFSDEREWRYVPQIELFDNEITDFIIDPDDYKTKRSLVDVKLKGMCLEFTYDDINYIIVEKVDQIEKIKKTIEQTYFLENPSAIKFPWEKLSISFFTQKQIQNDIFGIAHDVAILPTTTTTKP
jgi:hypothetical protein